MQENILTPKLVVKENKFCPGCGHGVIEKLICQVLEEKGLENEAVGIVAVGCACLITDYMGTDWIQAQHGRAPAVAAGVKHVRPGKFVFTYQGDGDAAAIGLSETMYAAKRNEPITTFFVNNGVFGMTGGQMAPTSLLGQKTTTSPFGCDYSKAGEPIKLAELLATFNVGYIARGSIANYSELMKTKKYISKAIDCQIQNRGYSFVEILSPCPTNWKMSPVDSLKRIETEAMTYFGCGELKGQVQND
ncbi:MAG: thiamine pyrophosphate-dependent enzyme [Eubacteriaceae bacterium]|jgi:2-oxoglutarate ferredoxin oxidoreductase subunit beta|nr:thiamine pyrophosphate-dependent enzyme [Eubacteriaceae bacterium]